MKKLIVLNIVGLTKSALTSASLPSIAKIIEDGFLTSMIPSFPAVTCSVQATITSGHYPDSHGIISNGLYQRSTKQVSFWEQYQSMVEKPRIWDVLKKENPKLKTAVLFWQNSLYINSDIVVTPKPIHLGNENIMWCYSKPVNYYEKLVNELGKFELKWYWGPLASIDSTRWILGAAKLTITIHKPDLLLVYIPHVDYDAQKYGPKSDEYRKSIEDVDKEVADFIEFLKKSKNDSAYEILIVSEYGFNQVNKSLSPNRILRNNELLSTRKIQGKEYLDFENSKAFAMVDHQISHVFIKPGYEEKVKLIFQKVDGINTILDNHTKKQYHIDHPRSGELILCSDKNGWFNYYWWNDEKYAPPFAFTVDIHRKPGFDPLELFLDHNKRISQNTSLIKGSHGLIDITEQNSLPIIGGSFKIQNKQELTDINQIFPTISKFFGLKSNTNRSLL